VGVSVDAASGSFAYFEHQADMGIIGRGATVEEAFSQAARAMFNLMVEVDRVKPRVQVTVECQANDRAELFVEWLNNLLAEADIRRMVLTRFQVDQLSDSHLKGSGWGESLDPLRHRPKIEVKAATYSMLFVGEEEGQYEARCVVDL
jgi:SHS2 domain-containing protein